MADKVHHHHHGLDLFQNVVSKFPSGVSLAFAYGSGVFKQEGNISPDNMIDFVFVVENSREWHAENMHLHPSHYSFLANLGISTVVNVQDNYGAGVYYNTLVPFEGRMIKYGVINIDNFHRDLSSWEWLYTSGRLHKPVQVIQRKQGSQIRTLLRENLTNAVNVALLCLPENFSEEDLYMTISWLSYAGDFRMVVGEDKGKVKKIVHSNRQGFNELYKNLLSQRKDMTALSSGSFQQDVSPNNTYSLLQCLPNALARRVINYAENNIKEQGNVLQEVANDRSRCGTLIRKGVGSIVLRSSITQSAKGILTAGLSKTLMYSSLKVSKMLRGMIK